jgi:type IV pilus assembly protein PilO
MKLSDVNWELSNLDTWTLSVKTCAIIITGLVTVATGIYFDSLDQYQSLQLAQSQEPSLKEELETKQKIAANLQDFQTQLNEVESSLKTIIKQMPREDEVASLLVDISQTGLSNGLKFKLFKPNPPTTKGFYVELPINIQVTGQYNELGLFISGLASLPRIVTLHDITITTENNEEALLMSAIVKTYYEAPEVTVIKIHKDTK